MPNFSNKKSKFA